MYTLYLFDLSSSLFNSWYLWFMGFSAILSGILVIVSKNPIVSVIFLITLFLSISVYLMLIGLNFMGLSYLLVYIGAVSILFLFILMLINVRVSELLNDTYNSLFLSIIIAFSFSINTNKIIPSDNMYSYFKESYIDYDKEIISYISPIKSVYYDTWDNNLIDNSYIFGIGNVLYTNYAILLIIASIILLLAMVGCILITKKN